MTWVKCFKRKQTLAALPFYSDFYLKEESMWHSHNQNMFEWGQYREVFEKLDLNTCYAFMEISVYSLFASVNSQRLRQHLDVNYTVAFPLPEKILCYVFNAIVLRSYIKLFQTLNVWQENWFRFILPKWIESLSYTNHSRKEEGCQFKTFSIFRMALYL